MTNLEWIRNMDAEQLVKDVLNPCVYHHCWRCPVKDACIDYDEAMKWLREEHREADR